MVSDAEFIIQVREAIHVTRRGAALVNFYDMPADRLAVSKWDWFLFAEEGGFPITIKNASNIPGEIDYETALVEISWMNIPIVIDNNLKKREYKLIFEFEADMNRDWER